MVTGNIENLRRAAAKKKADAVGRAEAGIRTLLRNGEAITFQGVAKAGSVSKGFLYANEDLKTRILSLRVQEKRHNPEPLASRVEDQDTSSIVRTLTTKLSAERLAHRAELAELRAALEAAHGEILLLRRTTSSGSQ